MTAAFLSGKPDILLALGMDRDIAAN
jgi:hypothetical protein